MLQEELFKHVPEYYPTMYMDGYTPEEIMYAKRKQMLEKQEIRESLKITVDEVLEELLKDFR